MSNQKVDKKKVLAIIEEAKNTAMPLSYIEKKIKEL